MKDSTTKNRLDHSINNQSYKEPYYVLFSGLILIVIWTLLSIAIGKSYILPSPIATVMSLIEVVRHPEFLRILMMTLVRVIVCVALSLIVGTVLAILAGLFRGVELLLKPVILVTRTLPTIVIIVYVILWMSSGWSPIFVTFLVTFPIVYANVLTGFQQTDSKLLEMAYIYKVKLSKKILMIYIPTIKPFFKSSMVAITSLGLKVVIASEVLSQTPDSIGKSFQIAKINIQTEVVFAWALITIILSLVLDKTIKTLMD